MLYGVMNRMAFWVLIIIIWCLHNGYILAGPVAARYQPNLRYLPPPFVDDTGASDSLQQASSVIETKHSLSYPNSYTTTSYKTNHITPEQFQTSPQLSSPKSVSTYSRTYHNSYVPQPSGIGIHLPVPPTPAPLPSLIPRSVLDQFASTSTSTSPSTNGSSIDAKLALQKSQSLRSIPSLSPVKSSSWFVETGYMDSGSSTQYFPPRSVIMFDSPASVLTPSQNEAISAVKLLASSLLQATDDSPIDKLDGFNVVNAKNGKEKDSNSTDVVIVKAQKNAYIIPMKLQIGNRNPSSIHDLYNIRDKLNKAYTINQFIFIIKPEHINFLNKLI